MVYMWFKIQVRPFVLRIWPPPLMLQEEKITHWPCYQNNCPKVSGLQQHQADAFGVEVMLVLLRLQSVGSFALNLRRNMQISQSRAEELARQVKKILFLPVERFLVTHDTRDDAVQQRQKQNHHPSGDVRPPVPPREPEVHSNIRGELVATEHRQEAPTKPTAVDIFKKRLEGPVSTPIEETVLEEKRPLNPPVPHSEQQTPDEESLRYPQRKGDETSQHSTPEEIARDPYREKI